MPQGIVAMKKLSESDDSDSKLEKGDSMCIKEWAIIEVQGDLKCKSGSSIGGKLIGQLIFSSKEKPAIVEYCILCGHIEKSNCFFAENHSIPDAYLIFMPDDRKKVSSNDLVLVIIKKRTVFKIQDKPVI